MNKCLALGCLALVTAFNSFQAQTQDVAKNMCGTGVPPSQWEEKFQALRVQAASANGKGNRAESAFTIPVIVHVIHGGQAVGTYPNLAQGQINSQILVWNEDYAGAGFNSGNYPLAAFSDWAYIQNLPTANLDTNGRIKIADCQVQFCLATKDTLGNTLPEPGIDRVNYVSMGWTNPASFSNITSFKNFVDGTVKPQTIWNVNNYLNLWITDVDVNNVGLLGYSTFPPLTGLSGLTGLGAGYIGTDSTDGVWCYSKAFGSVRTFSTGTYYPSYTYGRTSTHEVGHWLGLRHIWGDGDCLATDYCDDTPPASASNFGTPSYPLKTNVCSGNWPDGEMFMNFMDYPSDNAKYMFTTDQAARIQVSMGNSPYRVSMGSTNLCNVSNVAAQASFTSITSICTGLMFHLANTSVGFPPPTFTWSAPGATFIPSSSVMSPSVSFSLPGTYVISLSAGNSSVSIATKTIVLTSPPMPLSASDQSICAGSPIILSATGVDSYTWEPGDIAVPSFSDMPLQSQTYTCYGSLSNGCTATGSLSVFVSICTGINVFGTENANLVLYPNPAKDAFFVTDNKDYPGDITLEITDALGKSMMHRQLHISKNSPQSRVDISWLNNGIYFVRLCSGGSYSQITKLIKE